MGTFGNIVCKGVGIAGMSAVIYDAYSVAKSRSKKVALQSEADHFEQIHADSRTLSTVSPVSNAIQGKVQDLRMNMPVASFLGKVKGFTTGFLSSLGDNIVPVGLASLAIGTKGFFSKVGAWGVAGYGLYIVLKEGFGFSKKSSIE